MFRSSAFALSRPFSALRHRSTRVARQTRFYTDERSKATESVSNSGDTSTASNGAARTRLTSPVTWFTFGVITLVGGYVIYYFNREAKELEKAVRTTSAGKAAIGGPFTLVRDDGVPVTDADFRGRYVLLYFGFTYCPDICPAELRKMARVLELLKSRGIDERLLVPLFISVDPARDTVRQTRLYVQQFHPALRGLTGTPAQVAEAARQFRVYSSKTGKEGDTDYLVDHSIVQYLMDRTGQFTDYYGQPATAEEMAQRIEQHIAKRQ